MIMAEEGVVEGENNIIIGSESLRTSSPASVASGKKIFLFKATV